LITLEFMTGSALHSVGELERFYEFKRPPRCPLYFWLSTFSGLFHMAGVRKIPEEGVSIGRLLARRVMCAIGRTPVGDKWKLE
jgi:hypothetical protein